MMDSRSSANDWRPLISNPDERKVFEALEDSRWDFRTIRGLSASSGLPEERVRQVVMKYPNLVRQSSVLDRDGRELYTLASKGSSLREWLSTTRAYLSKTTASGA